METQTALIRADSAIELHAVTDIHLYLTLVINPGHTERGDTLGFHDALYYFCLFKFRMLVVHVLDGLQYFTNSLKVL